MFGGQQVSGQLPHLCTHSEAGNWIVEVSLGGNVISLCVFVGTACGEKLHFLSF